MIVDDWIYVHRDDKLVLYVQTKHIVHAERLTDKRIRLFFVNGDRREIDISIEEFRELIKGSK